MTSLCQAGAPARWTGTLSFCAAALLCIPASLCAQSAAAPVLLAANAATAANTSELPDAPQPTDDKKPELKKHASPDSADPQQESTSAPAQTQAPSSAQAPSLEDLGIQARPDPDLQKRLDRRTHMLKVHQRMGLITLAPLAAACLSSAAAPPDPRNGGGNTVGRDIHLSLGAVSVISYGITASYAIRAPKVSNEPARGGIKLHKYLIYVHAPGMVLTPILGAMAFQQANNGEKVHGIASAHSAVAWATVASYSAAIVAVSWPIHLHR